MTNNDIGNINARIAEYEYTIEKLQELGQIGTWKYDFGLNAIHWSREILQIFDFLEKRQFCFEDFIGAVHQGDCEYVKQNWPTELPFKKFDINHRLTVDDKLKWIRHRVDLDYDNDGNLESVIGFVQDITEFKFLEEKAIRAAQLAAVGEFTLMIAHEVNNPLSGVINYAQLFKVKACQGCERVELMDRIMSEGERIAKVVKNLLAFSSHSNGEKRAQKLNRILTNVLGLMGPKFVENDIIVEMELEDTLPAVCCNAQQIEQVVLNILRNANNALSSGTIEAETRRVIRIQAKAITILNHSYVELQISNNGPVIPSHLIERIKAPFYTTKSASVGTGLGLSMSSDILDDHNGLFEIKSNPGEYTEMIVRLPVADN